MEYAEATSLSRRQDRLSVNTAGIELIVRSCLFSGFRDVEFGGAIYDTTHFDLELKSVLFFDCQANRYGGALFKQSGTLNMIRCCYESCRISTNSVDSNYGNAFYVEKCASNLTMNMLYKCGYSLTDAGDSTGLISRSLFHVSYDNITYSGGYLCGIIYYALYPSLGSEFRFINVAHGLAILIFEKSGVDSGYQVYSSNFVDNNITSTVAAGTLCTVENSSFILIQNSPLNRTPGGFTFINCVANWEYPLFTFNPALVASPLLEANLCRVWETLEFTNQFQKSSFTLPLVFLCHFFNE